MVTRTGFQVADGRNLRSSKTRRGFCDLDTRAKADWLLRRKLPLLSAGKKAKLPTGIFRSPAVMETAMPIGTSDGLERLVTSTSRIDEPVAMTLGSMATDATGCWFVNVMGSIAIARGRQRHNTRQDLRNSERPLPGCALPSEPGRRKNHALNGEDLVMLLMMSVRYGDEGYAEVA